MSFNAVSSQKDFMEAKLFVPNMLGILLKRLKISSTLSMSLRGSQLSPALTLRQGPTAAMTPTLELKLATSAAAIRVSLAPVL